MSDVGQGPLPCLARPGMFNRLAERVYAAAQIIELVEEHQDDRQRIFVALHPVA